MPNDVGSMMRLTMLYKMKWPCPGGPWNPKFLEKATLMGTWVRDSIQDNVFLPQIGLIHALLLCYVCV